MGVITYTATFTAHTLTARELVILALAGGGALLVIGVVVALILWAALRKKPGPR